MLEAGIKTLDEVVKKDAHAHAHVDLTTTNPATTSTTTSAKAKANNAVDDNNNNAAAKEMISKLLEGGTAFKGEMLDVVIVDDDGDV